jgi:cyclase
MKAIKANAVVFALVLLAGFVGAEEKVTAPEITVTQVAPGITFLRSEAADADVVVYEGADGLIVIDTGMAETVAAFREAIRKVSNKPLRHVILTHYHFDHIGGAEAFAKEAPITAQENTRRRMMLPSHVGGRNDPPAPASALPVVTFGKCMTLYIGDEEIRLISFTAHTDSDAVVWFKRANVVDMGDAVLGTDNEGGGYVYGMAEASERIASMVPPDTKIVLRHVGVISVEQLREQGRQWRELADIVSNAMKQGKTLDQMKREKLLEGKARNPDQMAERIYRNLEQNGQK